MWLDEKDGEENVQRCGRRMDRNEFRNGAIRKGHVARERGHTVNGLREHKGHVDRLGRPLLTLLFRGRAAPVRICLRHVARVTARMAGTGSQFAWALTLGTAVFTGLGRRLPAGARRDASAKEGDNREGGNPASDHQQITVSHRTSGTSNTSSVCITLPLAAGFPLESVNAFLGYDRDHDQSRNRVGPPQAPERIEQQASQQNCG